MVPIIAQNISANYNSEAINNHSNKKRKFNFSIARVRNQEWSSAKSAVNVEEKVARPCFTSLLKQASKDTIRFCSQVKQQSVQHVAKIVAKEGFSQEASAKNNMSTVASVPSQKITELEERKSEGSSLNPFGSEAEDSYIDQSSDIERSQAQERYSLNTNSTNPFGSEIEELIDQQNKKDIFLVVPEAVAKFNLVSGDSKQAGEVDVSQQFLDELNKYIKSDLSHHSLRKNHYQKLKSRIRKSEYLSKLLVCSESDKSVNWQAGQKVEKKADYEKIYYAFAEVSGNGKLGEKNSSQLMQVLSRFLSNHVPETITAQVVSSQRLAEQVKSAEQKCYLTALIQYIQDDRKQLTSDMLEDLAYQLAQQKWRDEAKKLEHKTKELLTYASQKKLNTGTNQKSLERFITHVLHPSDYFRGHDAERQIKDYVVSASNLDFTYQRIITLNTNVVSKFFENEYLKIWQVITRQVHPGQRTILASERIEAVRRTIESAFRRLQQEKLREEVLWADNQFKTQIDTSIREFNPGQMQSLTDVGQWFSQFASTLDNYRLAQTAYREQLQNRLIIREGTHCDDTIIQAIIADQDKHFQQLQQSLVDKLINSIEPLEVAKYQPLIQAIEKLADDPTLTRVARAEALREKVLEYKQHLNTTLAMLSRHPNLTNITDDFKNAQAKRFQRIVADARLAFPEPLSRAQRIKQALFGEARKLNMFDRFKDMLQTFSNKIFFGIGVTGPLLMTIGALGGVSFTAAGASIVVAGPVLLVVGILCLAVSAVYASSKLLNAYAETAKENQRISRAKAAFDRLQNGDLWNMQAYDLDRTSKIAA
jgi:hypothetical protein